MEQVSDELNVTTITKTQSTKAKNYQKYFDVATTTRVNTQVKTMTYSRTKVVLITAYCVLALMLALVIANFIVISSMTNSITASKIAYQNELATSEYYQDEINKVTADIDDRLIDAGYIDGQRQVVEIAPVYVATETSEIQEQTNWFNELTKFISQVFGG